MAGFGYGVANGVQDLFSLLHLAPASSTAVVLPEYGISVTYESLRRQVVCMAETLAASGVNSGDRIAVVMPNGFPAIVSLLAAAIVGTAAPLNPAYRYCEFRFYLQDLSARVLICAGEGAGEAIRAAEDHRIRVFRVQVDRGIVCLSGASARVPVPPPSPQREALILHTSGTTGHAKRVSLKHIHLCFSCRNIVNTYFLSPQDISLCVMPLFHVHGLVGSVLATLFSEGAVVIPARFNPVVFWRLMQEYHVSWYSAVPTIHQLVLARASRDGKRRSSEHLRFIRSCSAALSPQLMEKMEDVLQVPVLEAYGMTEASHQICSNPLPPSSRNPGCVGKPAAVRIGVIDERGNHLAAGQLGEVAIQGPTVIEAYEGAPEINSACFTAGWLRTGDLGALGSDGALRLAGRIKELINRGGEKIAPREIDEVLLGHPAVAEAVAFGVPHPTWGEQVAAAVVLREPQTESELLRYCRDRLADFKCPKRIHITEAIPKTPAGKIRRSELATVLARVGTE